MKFPTVSGKSFKIPMGSSHHQPETIIAQLLMDWFWDVLGLPPDSGATFRDHVQDFPKQPNVWKKKHIFSAIQKSLVILPELLAGSKGMHKKKERLTRRFHQL